MFLGFCMWVQDHISGQARSPLLVSTMLEVCFLKFCLWINSFQSCFQSSFWTHLLTRFTRWALNPVKCLNLSQTDSAACHLALPTAFTCCALVSCLVSWDHPWLPPHPPSHVNGSHSLTFKF